MRIKIILMAVVLTGLLFCLSASAQVSCANPETTDEACTGVPISVTGLSYQRDIPKFDTSLGELQSVRITSEACGFTRLDLDSEHPVATTWFITTRGGIIITLPDGEEIIATFGTPQGTEDEIDTEADNDDAPDFVTTDSGFVEYGTADTPECDGNVSVFDTEAEMAIFKGAAGETLSVDILTFSNSNVRNPLSNNYLANSISRAGGSVCVEYTYCPRGCIIGSKVGCDDEPLSGWTITLTKPDGSTATNVTDADGQYSFCNLPAGSYDVCEETRPEWYPVGPTCYNDIILDGEDVFVPAFKNTEHFCISGYKYNVTNNAEDPLKDWKITLTKPDGSTVTDTTDDNGYYEFCDLANGQYKVSEELKTGWIAKSPASVNVVLYCEDEAVDFRNAKQPNLVCVCPFFIRNELYGASCKELKVVDASKGVISNDPPGSVVLNPESITIDPKYGTIEVNEDGSFVYDPTVATGRLYSGMYVMFKYNANNGLCDSVYPGIAKIQLRC